MFLNRQVLLSDSSSSIQLYSFLLLLFVIDHTLALASTYTDLSAICSLVYPTIICIDDIHILFFIYLTHLKPSCATDQFCVNGIYPHNNSLLFFTLNVCLLSPIFIALYNLWRHPQQKLLHISVKLVSIFFTITKPNQEGI